MSFVIVDMMLQKMIFARNTRCVSRKMKKRTNRKNALNIKPNIVVLV